MLLKNHLQEYKKDELLDLAEGLTISGCSKLRKAELIERLVVELSSEDVLLQRLTCLTDEELRIFEAGVEHPVDIGIDDIGNAMNLYTYMLGTFEEGTDRMLIFEELAACFKNIADSSFREEQKKTGWLVKCIRFSRDYYGIAPLEVIYKIYRLKVKTSIDEMIYVIYSLPMDVVRSVIVPDALFGNHGSIKDKALSTSKGFLINIEFLEGRGLHELLQVQKGKDFYIPSANQIQELTGIYYEESSIDYKKLKAYFKEKFQMDDNLATTWCLNTWANSTEGGMPTAIINRLDDSGIVFDSKEQLNEFIPLLMAAHNATRLRENRGHKPDEISVTNTTTNKPKVINYPFAANVMTEPVNGDFGVKKCVASKVYPNDTCPCGSGKKYKKCCGRK